MQVKKYFLPEPALLNYIVPYNYNYSVVAIVLFVKATTMADIPRLCTYWNFYSLTDGVRKLYEFKDRLATEVIFYRAGCLLSLLARQLFDKISIPAAQTSPGVGGRIMDSGCLLWLFYFLYIFLSVGPLFIFLEYLPEFRSGTWILLERNWIWGFIPWDALLVFLYFVRFCFLFKKNTYGFLSSSHWAWGLKSR